MMKYPIGIQDFEKLRRGGFVYVDKTELIYNLVNSSSYCFLSRPRRFGKSLLLSTIADFFEGKRDLFDGLAISQMEKEWTEYPVIRIDLSAVNYVSDQSLTGKLDSCLSFHERLFGIEVVGTQVDIRFNALIHAAYEQTGRPVVVLIDEYDKPLLETINNPELQEVYRKILRGFYGNLKSCDQYIRFAMLTGVTRFGKVSVFSDLNNLDDISLDHNYATICGITEQELHASFDDGVARLAERYAMSRDECYAKLRRDYDGYHFSPGSPGMYNPFSVLKTLRSSQFGDYWFETGTPDFLVQRLQQMDYPLADLTLRDVSAYDLVSIDNDDSPIALLYQSGYLTIKGYDSTMDSYSLDFPNREVSEGFTKFIYPYYTPRPLYRAPFSVRHFLNDILSGNAEGFVQRLQALFADGDYRIVGNREIYFQNTLYVFFKLLGFYVDVERPTSSGRMDALIKTGQHVYIIEIKVDQSAAVALQQIEERQYAAPFAADARRVHKIGINFNSQTRKIDEYLIV